ncbi:hypothetical protein JMN32_13145 [Fulvivirga sp. 29W222]|uniref:Uncharacterized protein n=1 Tax=Fulvivirga marina TaxID=2494733 RepID=A0A937FYC7_9BACT|nr:hypothetical protein [Fulvivirga marina]MBL6447262.1 hypothetical protein [Fulvivirga marina]
MKTSVKILFFVSLFTGILAFHNKTRESNTFDYRGETYQIPHAYLENFGMHPDTRSYDYDLHLGSTSKPEFIHTTALNYVYLDLHSNSSQVISSGTYDFKESEGKERNPFTFTGAEVLINYDINHKKGESLYATGGTVKVSQWEGKYVIEFYLKLNNGESIEGIYKGKLTDWETDA